MLQRSKDLLVNNDNAEVQQLKIFLTSHLTYDTDAR